MSNPNPTGAIERLIAEARELCFNNHVPMARCGCSEMITTARAELASLREQVERRKEALDMVEQLKAELAQAREANGKSTLRFQWLIKNRAEAIYAQNEKPEPVWWVAVNGIEVGRGKTPDEAIDAALSSPSLENTPEPTGNDACPVCGSTNFIPKSSTPLCPECDRNSMFSNETDQSY